MLPVMIKKFVFPFGTKINQVDYLILSDIIEDDCKVLEEGITKCSRWLPGHDQAPAENITVPDPAELKRDIESLENWKKTINKRRK